MELHRHHLRSVQHTTCYTGFPHVILYLYLKMSLCSQVSECFLGTNILAGFFHSSSRFLEQVRLKREKPATTSHFVCTLNKKTFVPRWCREISSFSPPVCPAHVLFVSRSLPPEAAGSPAGNARSAHKKETFLETKRTRIYYRPRT